MSNQPSSDTNSSWSKQIFAVTLFVVDLAASKRFYEKAFGLPAVFETENSAVQGIELLNGPIDRWWGPRTASFSDLDGHVWEIATHVR